MIMAGKAQIMGYDEGREYVDSRLIGAIPRIGVACNVPGLEDGMKGWSMFCVVGVSVPEMIGDWCGCVEGLAVGDDVGLGFRMFHRRGKTPEPERRVAIIWKTDSPDNGFVLFTREFAAFQSVVDFYMSHPEIGVSRQ